MTRQRNVTFQEALGIIFLDDDSEYEVDDSDDGWGPDSNESEEEESETVVESGDNTAVLAEHAKLVNFGASTSRGAGNITCMCQ